MARAINKLTARQVATLKEPGRHSDGGGLYLRITPAGSRSWLFMSGSGASRKELSLDPVASVTLATARRLAAEMREAAATGVDLQAQRRSSRSPAEAAPAAQPTFSTFAEAYISSVEAGWKNPVHRQQWLTVSSGAAASATMPSSCSPSSSMR